MAAQAPHMAYLTHHFDTTIALHPVRTWHFTVVYLPDALAATLPFAHAARLRIEADVSGVPVLGAWQPSNGRWFLMLPKRALRSAGLAVGSPVEVAFRLVPTDFVRLPPELEHLLQAEPALQAAWARLTAGKRRGLACMVSAARKPETRQARLAQVRSVVLGESPEPWMRSRRTPRPPG